MLTASPEKRKQISLAFFDFLHSNLAIKAEALTQIKQEEIRNQSWQHLTDPWCIDENETLHISSVAFARPKKAADNQGDLFITPAAALACG